VILLRIGNDKQDEERKITCRHYLERVNKIALEKNNLIPHANSKSNESSYLKSKMSKISK